MEPRHTKKRNTVLLLAVLLLVGAGIVAWAAAPRVAIFVNGAKLREAAITQGEQVYVPLAAVRQIPGVSKVQWDGHNVKIETQGRRPTPGAYLADMRVVAGSSSRLWPGAAKVNGKSYPKSLTGSAGEHTEFCEYDLSRKYSALDVVLGLDDTSRNADATVTFEVFGDGQSLFRSDPVKLGTTYPLHLPVAGVLRLRIAITGGDANSYNAVAVYGDAKVH